MQHLVLNKVNLEEAEEERVHGHRVDSEAGGGDDVGAHHDQQDWDEAAKRDQEMRCGCTSQQGTGRRCKKDNRKSQINVDNVQANHGIEMDLEE